MQPKLYYVFDETLDPLAQLSEHFMAKEFKCSDNSRVIVLNKALIDLLEEIRTHFNAPVIINSGYRTVQYNSQLKESAPGSQHTLGNAADIRVTGHMPTEVYQYLDSSYPNSLGLGIYSTFVHVDVRESKSRFDKRTAKK